MAWVSPDKACFSTEKYGYCPHFSTKTFVGTLLKCLTESYLMIAHNVCFNGEIRILLLKLSSHTLLNVSEAML